MNLVSSEPAWVSASTPLPPTRSRRSWLFWVTGLALAISVLWWTRLRWLPEIGTALDVSDPLSFAPVVLVLPGSEESRPIVAAGLIRAGFADLVLIPETRSNPDVYSGVLRSTSELTRKVLNRRGIPNTRIATLRGISESTLGDAVSLDLHFQQFGVSDVTIVTSAYHSRRARWAFRHVLPEHQHRLRFYSAPNGFDARSWWTSRRGRQAVLSEWLKIAFYLMYPGQGWLWCLVSTMLGGVLVFARHHRKGN